MLLGNATTSLDQNPRPSRKPLIPDQNSSSLGIVVSGGGTRSAYAVGALRALAEIHHVKAPKVLVAMSGGAAAGTFYLAGRFNEMYDWARLFDDSRFISWKRLGRGPVMDINFLVDQILRRQAPSLQRELADVPTKCCIAATKFPEGTLHWFEDEPLFEQLRATKTFPGIGGTVVKIGGSYYADGCLTASVEDCVEKAFKEGADTVVVIDNTSYDAIPAAVRTILLIEGRRTPTYVRRAIEKFCAENRKPNKPIEPTEKIYICRPEHFPTKHGLVRSHALNYASIEQGYADASKLRFVRPPSYKLNFGHSQ